MKTDGKSFLKPLKKHLTHHYKNDWPNHIPLTLTICLQIMHIFTLIKNVCIGVDQIQTTKCVNKIKREFKKQLSPS